MDGVLVSALATPFGAFFLASRGGAFIASSGPVSGEADAMAWGVWRWEDAGPAGGAHAAAHEQVEAYFAGTLENFALPLDLPGNELQRAAWEVVQRIPYGGTMTYGEVAWEIGAPGAARAAGRAMAICPAPLLVPLHRVIGAGGRRCGDLTDWQRRMTLLAFEREERTPADLRAGGKGRIR